MKKYTLTEEHKAKLPEYAKRWTANAFSTKLMDEAERETCRDAVRRMYELAGLTPPPPHRIVFVPSPFVARFAAGFAASIWWLRSNPRSPLSTAAATAAAAAAATDAATAAARAATDSATLAATDAARAATEATDAATDAATEATEAATFAATDAATSAATDSDALDATKSATLADAWWLVPGLAEIMAFGASLAPGGMALQCAQNAWRFYQGGNMWSGWSAYLTFFRYEAELPIDWEKFDPWEKLSEHSGPRFVHEKFCIISDRPERLLVDAQSRPHCSDGPFCRWRDGSELYALNGVRMPAKYVLTPAEKLDPTEILKEPNADIRRELIRKVGVEMMLAHLPHKALDTQGNYSLLRIDFPDLAQDTRYLKMLNPSIGVWHLEGVERTCNTVQQALNWRAGRFAEKADWKPSQLT